MSIYRRLLWLAPAALRTRHGAAMEALFCERLDEVRGRGRLAVATVWMAAIGDLLASRLRLLSRRPRIARGSSPVRRPVMFGTDMRFALRALLRQKLGAGLAVAMLAVGIAANVAVFSLVNGLFLRPFPYPEPDRLVFFNERAPKLNMEISGINYPDFDQWRQGQQAMEAMALWDMASYNLSTDGRAERLVGLSATHDLANVLKVTPLHGRLFTAEEDVPGGPDVIVLGYRVWQDRFGGAPDIVGRTVQLSGRAYDVIGVLPEHALVYPGEASFWIPYRGDPAATIANHSGMGIGRLKPGVTPQQAEGELLRAHQPIWEARGDKEHVVSPFVVDLREFSVRTYRPIASILPLAVGLLLFVACANVASVMLARGLARRREMGIRLAVGASRARLIRQLLFENALLALAGGALGLVLGHLTIQALIASLPEQAPAWARFVLDGRVVAFALAISSGTVLLFGWAPAMHALRGDLRAAMHHATTGTTVSPRGRRTLWALLGVEFALAALLLVSGGLLWRAYDRVRDSDPGFDPTGVLSFRMALPPAIYAEGAPRLAFWDRLLERIQTTPGVTDAGLVNCEPFFCHWGMVFEVEGQPPTTATGDNPVVLYRYASGTYLSAMGIRATAGRLFDARDGRDGVRGQRPIIVNEEFARTFLPGVDPIGRRVRSNSSQPWQTVVGVVHDAKHYGLEQPMRPGVYQPLPINPLPTMTAVVKTTGDPVALASTMRALVHELDPELPLFNVQTMDEALRRSMAVRTVYSWMLAVFACVAALLALGGTYGVTSYLTAQRLREMGIRVALGARRGDIVRSVLRGSLAVIVFGIAVGILASIGATGLIADLLFGVSPTDLGVIAGTAAVLLFTALLANVIPARRAAVVDPMVSLRSE